MNEANCMDLVIKRVDAATYPEQPGRKRVVIDLNRKTAVGTAWFRSEASLKYFLVSTGVAARCQTRSSTFTTNERSGTSSTSGSASRRSTMPATPARVEPSA